MTFEFSDKALSPLSQVDEVVIEQRAETDNNNDSLMGTSKVLCLPAV